MPHQTYVFTAELVGFEGVRRTVAVRNDLTLVDLHYALQSAFGWDDDHLYSFWLDGASGARRPRTTCIPSTPGRSIRPARAPALGWRSSTSPRVAQIAYVFDLEREWRVALTVREIHAGGRRAVAQMHRARRRAAAARRAGHRRRAAGHVESEDGRVPRAHGRGGRRDVVRRSDCSCVRAHASIAGVRERLTLPPPASM